MVCFDISVNVAKFLTWLMYWVSQDPQGSCSQTRVRSVSVAMRPGVVLGVSYLHTVLFRPADLLGLKAVQLRGSCMYTARGIPGHYAPLRRGKLTPRRYICCTSSSRARENLLMNPTSYGKCHRSHGSKWHSLYELQKSENLFDSKQCPCSGAVLCHMQQTHSLNIIIKTEAKMSTKAPRPTSSVRYSTIHSGSPNSPSGFLSIYTLIYFLS